MTSKTIDRSISVPIRTYWATSARDANPTPQSGFSSRILKVTRTRTGEGVPDWRGRIRNKLNATSNLTARYESLTSEGPLFYQSTYLQDEYGFWGDSQGRVPFTCHDEGTKDWPASSIQAPPMNFSWSSTADRQASNAFLAAIRSEYTAFSAGTFFGELHQTLRMIKSPAEALFKTANEYLKALQKVKRLRPRAWKDAIPSLWLEYTFGWKPLISDIGNAFDAANSMLETEHVVRIKGRGQSSGTVASYNYSTTEPFVPGKTNYLLARVFHQVRETEQVKYYGAINVKPGSDSTERWARWGFTPDDFVPTAWELLPWSFLIDYFASIGDFIGGVFTQTGNVSWCSKVNRRESETICTTDPYAPKEIAAAQMRLTAGRLTVARWKRVDVSRYASAGVPTPSLYIKTNGPSLGQFANISALFGQACVNLHSQNLSGNHFRLPR